MKWNLLACLALICCIGTVACNNNSAETPPAKKVKSSQVPKLNVWAVPTSGTEVAQFSKKIAEDELNDFKFKVVVKTNDNTANSGAFDITYSAGVLKTTASKPFPKWYENNVVQPIIKPVDSLKYGALVGFDPGDGTFKELYLVSYIGGQLKLTNTKNYSITTNISVE